RGTMQPRTLANAFLNPVVADGAGLMVNSVNALMQYRTRLAAMYGFVGAKASLATIHPLPQGSRVEPAPFGTALDQLFPGSPHDGLPAPSSGRPAPGVGRRRSGFAAPHAGVSDAVGVGRPPRLGPRLAISGRGKDHSAPRCSPIRGAPGPSASAHRRLPVRRPWS